MRNGLISTLVVLLLITGAGVAAYATDFYSLRSELESRVARSGVQVLEGEVRSRSLKEFNFFSEKIVPLPISGRLIDYVPEGYAITFNNGDWNVEALATQTLLATSSSNKLWLNTSANDRYLVFAERPAYRADSEVLAAAVDIYNPAEWTINLIDLKTGTKRTDVRGSMPRFFDRDGNTYLLYLAPNEVRVRVILGTWQEFALPYEIDGLWPAEVSPDGKYLALYNMDLTSYEIFTFELTEGTIKLTPLPRMPVQVRILAFKGSELYASAWFPEGERAELVKIDLEHPESYMVLSDRSGLEHVRKIIPAP